MKSFGNWLPLTSGIALLLYACARQLAAPVSLPEAEPTERPRTPSPRPSVPESLKASEPSAVLPSSPVLDPEFLRMRAHAQARILDPGNEIQDELGRHPQSHPAVVADAGAALHADGNRLGHFVPIENVQALEAFLGALDALKTGSFEAKKLRVLAYGASHTQGDFFTGYLRYYLQSRFGNGGVGFVQLALVNRWYRLLDVKVESNAFKIQHAQKKQIPEHGRFGLLGAAAIGRSAYARASLSPSPRAPEGSLGNQMELYYMREPEGGDLLLRIDDREIARLSTKADSPEPAYHSFSAPEGWSNVSVRPRGNGAVRLFGATIETDGPGVVIDTLGINGTRAANMLLWNEALWAEHARRRDPRLVLLAYGTNEGVDTKQPIAEYETNLRLVVERFKHTLPEASCVLLGPGDFPKEVPGGYLPRPRLLEIIDVQRKLAFEYACGFFDTFAFMGGEGSMQRWALAIPPMGARDHIHLSVRGYVRWGMTFGDALLLPFDGRGQRPAVSAAGSDR